MPHQEMVDFVLKQGRTKVDTAGVAALLRGYQPAENKVSGQKMPFLGGMSNILALLCLPCPINDLT